MTIKVVLLLALAGAGLMVVRGNPSSLNVLMRRSMTIITIALGAFAVLFPDAVTAVAKLVGVGRGTDLLLYVLALAFLFLALALYMRLAAMQDRNVTLVRHLALLEARFDELAGAEDEPLPVPLQDNGSEHDGR